MPTGRNKYVICASYYTFLPLVTSNSLNWGRSGILTLIIDTPKFSGLFHGLRPTFAREMPGYFCFFFAYEYSRELLTPPGNVSLFFKFRFNSGYKIDILEKKRIFIYKGQLISKWTKCPFGVIVWTKIPTKKIDKFCPRI